MQDAVILGLRWIDIINFIAIIAGPILAVWVEKMRQERADARDRKLAVFRSLMRTRRLRLDPEHVGALNLVDLEFYGCARVIQALEAYMDNLSGPIPPESEIDRFTSRRTDLLISLIFEIGKELKFSFDKKDLEKSSYGPAAWQTEQDTARQNLIYVNEMLSGKRALPVTAMQPPSANPFPPPPSSLGA